MVGPTSITPTHHAPSQPASGRKNNDNSKIDTRVIIIKRGPVTRALRHDRQGKHSSIIRFPKAKAKRQKKGGTAASVTFCYVSYPSMVWPGTEYPHQGPPARLGLSFEMAEGSAQEGPKIREAMRHFCGGSTHPESSCGGFPLNLTDFDCPRQRSYRSKKNERECDLVRQ